ncbi:MAG: glycoside hydrolase family 3 C-terminal domain-containing protein [Propionibacteriaceae bacterium]|nr:glycoside hydrolase family 3 C-terminal domain-containing protein [Propionibacteriaceae bacterium]
MGPTAAEPLSLMGCYAFPNHVLAGYSGDSLGLRVDTIKDAVEAELGAVTYARGVPIREVDTSGIEDAVAAGSDAEVVVLCVGDLPGMFGHGTSGEGCDVEDLRLPGSQGDLVEAILDAGPSVVLVVCSGRPYALGAYVDRCAAVVQAFLPGCEGAAAIAGVLSGRVNPSGKLPVQIPQRPGGQPGTYLGPHFALVSGSSNLDLTPAFAFGHGLSYTTFAHSDLSTSSREVPTDGSVDVTVTVTNTGDRAGVEVVQLYGHDVAAQVVRPLRELLGYARVALEPGESRRVTFGVHTDRLSFSGLRYERIVEPGEHRFAVGASSADLPLEATVTLTGGTRVVGEGRALRTHIGID